MCVINMFLLSVSTITSEGTASRGITRKSIVCISYEYFFCSDKAKAFSTLRPAACCCGPDWSQIKIKVFRRGITVFLLFYSDFQFIDYSFLTRCFKWNVWCNKRANNLCTTYTPQLLTFFKNLAVYLFIILFIFWLINLLSKLYTATVDIFLWKIRACYPCLSWLA